MNEVKLRHEVQTAVTNYIMSVMSQNNVAAHIMEDAVNAALLTLKPYVQAELVQAIVSEQEEQCPAESDK